MGAGAHLALPGGSGWARAFRPPTDVDISLGTPAFWKLTQHVQATGGGLGRDPGGSCLLMVQTRSLQGHAHPAWSAREGARGPWGQLVMGGSPPRRSGQWQPRAGPGRHALGRRLEVAGQWRVEVPPWVSPLGPPWGCVCVGRGDRGEARVAGSQICYQRPAMDFGPCNFLI